GDGQENPDDAREPCTWKLLCLAGEYQNHILKLTEEVCQKYRIDGLFYDIFCLDIPCVCPSCVKGMRKRGLDPSNGRDAFTYMVDAKIELMEKCRAILHQRFPDAQLFCNSGGAEVAYPQFHPSMTYFELEDLPTVGGYDKIYNRAKYFSVYGKDIVGITGKFHDSWGEFGGFKPAEALKYECAAMLMLGIGCNIGDQLHPSSRINRDTYKNIGYAYQYVRQIEQYCFGCRSAARLGFVLAGNESDDGISKMLLENQIDYEIVFENDDLIEKFDCIVISDGAALSDRLAPKINAFTAAGKALIFGGATALKDGRFVLDAGIEYISAPAFDIDYIVCGPQIRPSGLASPFLSYSACHKIAAPNFEVLAGVMEPYFSRTNGRYCSHRNTPDKDEIAPYPAVVKRGGIVYFAHEAGRIYHAHGNPYIKETFVNALRLVYEPAFKISGLMSLGRSRLTEKGGKLYLHLLYAPPIARDSVIMLEDFPVLSGIQARIRTEKPVKGVRKLPSGGNIDFSYENGQVSFVVDGLKCHQLIEIY
ncbi:MAG: hypothetical protein FWE62_00460, partial [Firmicutes bacterium]|nr:hypothetical protein [Bacillota bacterium]